MGIEIAIATAAVVSAAGSVYSASRAQSEQKKANKAQKRAQAESQNMQRAQQAQENAIQRRQQIREERVRRAQIIQSSQTTGTRGGSGESGALSGLGTQFGTGGGILGFNQQQQQRATNIGNFQQSAVDAQGRAQTWGQIYGLSGSIFQAAGGFNTLASPFRNSGTPAPVQETTNRQGV